MTSNTKQFGWLGVSMISMAIAIFISTAARASSTATAYYQLGEADTSAAANTPPLPGDGGGAITVDSSGHGFDLTAGGSPVATYSSNAAPANGSTLSMAFVSADNDIYSRPVSLTSAITDVRIDAWAYPTTTTVGGYVVLNGSGSNGYGIYQNGNVWSFIEEFVSFNNATGPLATVVPNQWVHLTLLLDHSGTLTGYINDTLVVTQAAPANAPAGNFSIGSAFQGNVDEVSLFLPEPASASILFVSGLALMGLRRRR